MMPPAPAGRYPEFYSNLDLMLAEAFACLSAAVNDRKSAMHTPVLATLGLDSTPQARTVVLRAFDTLRGRSVRFNADVRSPKWVELAANPACSLLFYEPTEKIQIRLSGRAELHHNNATAAAVWAATPSYSQKCYHVITAPSAAIQHPETDAALTLSAAAAAANFGTVVVHFTMLDFLYLAANGHRRAKFVWDANGGVTSNWVVP